MTADELLRLPTGMGERYELVNGELMTMTPAGYEHGDIALELGARLRVYARTNQLGRVSGAETGFRLRSNPDTVRAADVAFVSQARIPPGRLPQGFFPGAPDLAVEIISPSEAAAEIQRKVTEYFTAGSHLVWVVYPDLRQVVVFRSARQSMVLAADDTLDGGELLPGFTCRVAELFE
jgi:Uma2 family endonuclease